MKTGGLQAACAGLRKHYRLTDLTRKWQDTGCFRPVWRESRPLLQQDAGALDFLAAQRAEEAWNQAIHQLEIR
jgi:hypothetical protein